MSLRCTLGTILLSPWVPLMFMLVMGTIWAVRIPVNLKRNILILTDMKREKHIKCNLFGRKLAAIHCIIIANTGICVWIYFSWFIPQNKCLWVCLFLSEAYFFVINILALLDWKEEKTSSEKYFCPWKIRKGVQ